MKEINKEIKKPKPFFNHNPDAYALEMRESDQWLYSHLEPKPDGTWSKPPCNAAGTNCDGTDPNNLTSFEIAFPTCKANLDKLSGLGFSIQSSSPIKAIDMNHVFEGEWNQQALDELRLLNTRVEWSPSHTGVHVFFTCPIMLESKNKTQPDGTGREIYFEKHYLTVTGQVVEGFPETINEVDPELIIQLYDKWFPAKEKTVKETAVANDNCLPVKADPSTFDIPEAFVNDPDDPLQGLSPNKDQLIELCRNAPGIFGERFLKLMAGDISDYNYDESDADMALSGMIAFHTSDHSIIKAIIQDSKLWDEKWEREDYCFRTIDKAIANSRIGKAIQPNKAERTVPDIVIQTPDVEAVIRDDEIIIPKGLIDESDVTELYIPQGYGISSDGLIINVFNPTTRTYYPETICHSPIYLTGIAQDIDSKEIYYEVSFTDVLGHHSKSMYKQEELILKKNLKATSLPSHINIIDRKIGSLV